jgi:hypothetical protein
MVNDLRVCERLASLEAAAWQRRPAEIRCRHFLGVKWSQVQILSARQREVCLDLLFSVAKTAIMVQLLFVWDHVFGCEAFFGRTCPMVK